MRIPPDVPSNDVLTTVLDASSDLVVVFDAHGHVHDLNASAERLLGRQRDAWIGAPLIEHVHPDDRTRVIDLLADILAGSPQPSEPVSFRAAHADGYWTTLEVTGGRRIDGDGRWSAILILRDLTQLADERRRLRQTAQELDFVASHDELTGLPNRQVLRARVGALSRRLRSADRPPYLIMLRILGLDDLRNSHGDDAVASAVRTFAGRVIDVARTDGFVAAEGAGTLVVVTDSGVAEADVDELATRLSALSEAAEIPLAVAVGVSAMRPSQSASVALDQLARRTTTAGSSSTLRVPEPRPGPTSNTETDRPAVARVRRALHDDLLALWFQPIHDTRTGRLDGFEGLLRWIDPDGGVIVAGDFLPGVESSSLMLDIDELVMSTGCRQLAEWQGRLGVSAPTLSLNVSAQRLRHGCVAGLVHEQLRRSGADPAGLCLEVTETHVIVEEPAAARQLGELRDLGVRLALDDFGTGSSSLGHLRDIRADELKIDRAFVELLGRDAGATAIVRASVEMGAAFGMTTTAEGVTTTGQRRFLHQIGCDRVQGFLIGPAVPPSSADAMVDADAARRSARSDGRLQGIEQGRRELGRIDDHYRPSEDEIAAVAGVSPDDVRAAEAPPRR